MDVSTFLTLIGQVIASYQAQIIGLLVMIVVDVLMGIAAAIKTKTFQWVKVGDFYRVSVLPQFLGWIALTIALHAATPEALGPAKEMVAGATSNFAWGVVMINLGASVGKSAKEVYGVDLPVKIG